MATEPTPTPQPTAGDKTAEVEALCKTIAAVVAGKNSDACDALADLGKALGLQAGDKRKVTNALRSSSKTIDAKPAIPDLPIADEAKRLRERARKEHEQHPMPVYEDYQQQKRAHQYRDAYAIWERESMAINAFNEAAGRLEDCVESMSKR